MKSPETPSDSEHWYTNSELQCFKSCRRRWYLRYVRGLRPKVHAKSGHLALGSAVHYGIQRYNERNPDPVSAMLSDIYVPAYAEAHAAGDDPTPIAKDERLATIMLRGYIEWAEAEGIDAELHDTESEKFLTLTAAGVTLAGTLDLRARDWRGTRVIRDYKTVQTLELPFNQEQLLHYGLLDCLTEGDHPEPFVGQYVLLKKVLQTKAAKPPYYKLIPVYVSADEIISYSERMADTILDIEHTLETQRFYPTPTSDCHWKCEYYEVCPMFDNNGNPEEYLEEHYDESGDVYSRGFWGGQEPPGSDVPIAAPRRRR